MSTYREYDFDDPYKLLATSLAANYRLVGLRRIVTDPKFVKRQIRREARGQDLRGPFVDCIFAATKTKAERQEIIARLDELGAFLYTKLDQPRLRKEILEFCNDCGVELLPPDTTQDIIGV